MSSPLGYADFQVPPPPPPLPLGRGWLWFTIAVTTASIAIAGTSIVLLAAWAGRDYPDVIDNDKVLEVVRTECGRMTESVSHNEPAGSPREVAKAIIEQDAAVQDMINAIGDMAPKLLDSDRPTRAWLGDWQRFVDARESIADGLNHGRFPDYPKLRTADGTRIFVRMEFAADDCPIPDTLLNPYPAEPDDEV